MCPSVAGRSAYHPIVSAGILVAPPYGDAGLGEAAQTRVEGVVVVPPGSGRWLQLGPTTIGLIVLNVAGFAVLTWQPGLVDVLGLASGRDTLAQQPWTVVTVMFTSGHLLHLAAAVGIILFLGGAVERRVGSLHLLGIYLLSGAAGSVAVATASSAGAGNAEVSVGASAAFLGLLGAVTAGPASPLVERLQLSKVVGVVLVVNLALPVLGIGYWTNSVAHVAGIAVGALYGYVLRTRSSTVTGAIPASIQQPSSAGRESSGNR